MATIASLTTSYEDDEITVLMSTGEVIVISIVATPVDSDDTEIIAQSEHRIGKLISGVLGANLRYLKSLPDIIELP